jgi:hypothetical protein
VGKEFQNPGCEVFWEKSIIFKEQKGINPLVQGLLQDMKVGTVTPPSSLARLPPIGGGNLLPVDTPHPLNWSKGPIVGNPCGELSPAVFPAVKVYAITFLERVIHY